METYSSWMNCPKEKCVSADLMHLFLVRFVTVRLTYIFIDYPDCEYIIILNTSIVIYDLWRLSVLRSSTPSMPIFGNRHRQKACLLTNTRMIHTHYRESENVKPIFLKDEDVFGSRKPERSLWLTNVEIYKAIGDKVQAQCIKGFSVCARCGESTWIMRRTDSHCWFKE